MKKHRQYKEMLWGRLRRNLIGNMIYQIDVDLLNEIRWKLTHILDQSPKNVTRRNLKENEETQAE